jgi:hypothetical protein
MYVAYLSGSSDGCICGLFLRCFAAIHSAAVSDQTKLDAVTCIARTNRALGVCSQWSPLSLIDFI